MKQRSKARRYIIQALYSWLLSGQDIKEIALHFAEDHEMSGVDADYFHESLEYIANHRLALIDHFEKLLSRPFSEVDPVEQAILLLGTYELTQRLDVPFKVVINESVELAKTFGAEEGHKFINGILDKLALKVREAEFKSKKKKN